VKNESVLVETVDYKIQAQSIESSKCLLSFSRFSECQQKSQISEGRFVALFWVVLTEGSGCDRHGVMTMDIVVMTASTSVLPEPQLTMTMSLNASICLKSRLTIYSTCYLNPFLWGYYKAIHTIVHT